MNIVICTTPIRPVPTDYPPFGSLAIIQSLRHAGYDPYFYDIDIFRPSDEEVEKFFRERQPDVVGISAVVSTAYGYTKRLAGIIRRVCPQARLIIGGNLAASAEVLFRKAGIDIAVVGEGEVVIENLIKTLEKFPPGKLDYDALADVKGITYLLPDGQMNFTGFELRLPADKVFVPDFTILEKYSKIDHFFRDPLDHKDFASDQRSYEPRRQGKKLGTLLTEKGCVARCTFCHRWDKGYRAVPVEQIMNKVRYIMDRYNVGFIRFGDENFGSDKRQTRELIAQLKQLDILWAVSGVRVKSVSPDLLKDMKDAGCTGVYYGMETGSPKILEVMEKKATVEDNINAAIWTDNAGLYTVHQLVIGMPGESNETIRETTDFIKTVTQDLPQTPRQKISINYIQALPGTPVFEYARAKGLIGKSIEDEEAYLLTVSDINAGDDTKFINYTGQDYLTVRSWRRLLVLEALNHYYKHNKIYPPSFLSFLYGMVKSRFSRKNPGDAGRDGDKSFEDYNQGGYFNISGDLPFDVIVAYFYPLRHFILAGYLLADEFRRLPFNEFIGHVFEWVQCRMSSGKTEDVSARSLRQVMAELTPTPQTQSERAMQPLRDGR